MKTTHFYLASDENAISNFFTDPFIAPVGGKVTGTVKDFVSEVAAALDYPEEPGKNLDALEELLSDLQWIEEQRVVLYISDSDSFLSKEKEDKTAAVIDLLDAIAEDWAWSDEEEDFAQKQLAFVFEESQKIRDILAAQDITYHILL